MGGIISTLFGGAKPEGPSKAELFMQKEQRDKAIEERSEAERLRALASQRVSRQRSLAYVDNRAATTLGGAQGQSLAYAQ